MGQERNKGRTHGFFAELEGDNRLVLSGCGGILTYTEDCIRMRTSFGSVAVYGSRLEMGCMTADGAAITGRLQRIEWER